MSLSRTETRSSIEPRTMLVLENFIGGKFVPCRSHIDSYDPSTGEVYCKVPDSGEEAVEDAVAAAKEAFPGWAAQSPEQRAQILNKLADLIEAHLEEFAQAESKDQDQRLQPDGPRGLPQLHHALPSWSGLISPWNLPLYLLTWKIAPAIAAGNTVVAKPSEMTSVTAWMMCKMMQQAGVPPGVVNVVFGTGPRAGDVLVGHPDVPLISFTGSTATARRITERSAPYCKKLSLELGGKNPAVIFADADLDRCIETTVRSSFSNQGEICLCTSRIYVERSVYPVFLDKFVAAARKWKTGVPSDATNNNGALISKDHLEKVRGFVTLAKSEGATVHCGEGVDPLDLPERYANGYFMGATVITGVPRGSRVMQEEIFGPVTCVSPFDGEDEAVAEANGVRYGLAATVWSRDVAKVHRVAARLQAGLVWTNCWLVRDLMLPFGGMKMSGVGREGGKDSYHFFTEIKTITIKH
ncbi:2-aminomuconic semialdehyde dehydrogenase isoform X2 [Syngnathoides biaculeatus]|uniref:2-aminomuconic semialdehyde dehydrogenase isoform X2 n=1 Tax=Syngnathoides biaculeatus TaxID=300417 RepID=UPI002ADE7A09|nr:2-aminomuconic semialdehyde dehydrogenase isoform X2 [Syngnathoides biaculeatus]